MLYQAIQAIAYEGFKVATEVAQKHAKECMPPDWERGLLDCEERNVAMARGCNMRVQLSRDDKTLPATVACCSHCGYDNSADLVQALCDIVRNYHINPVGTPDILFWLRQVNALRELCPRPILCLGLIERFIAAIEEDLAADFKYPADYLDLGPVTDELATAYQSAITFLHNLFDGGENPFEAAHDAMYG
jgi:hypothetical protein